MGNPQHLEWLLEGVKAWNARRKADDFEPDLSGFDILRKFDRAGHVNELGRVSLAGINLRWADIQAANLWNVDLRKADLREAYLKQTELRYADLSGSDCRLASLVRSALRGAKLNQANLRGANFSGAILAEADLRLADLREVAFSGANLWGANVTTSMHSKSNSPEYTNLSEIRELSQAQVDKMTGDTGTILPRKLTHPPHWPDPEGVEAPSSTSDKPKPAPDTTVDPATDKFSALKDQVQVILAAPVQTANTAKTFAVQLDYATRAFRKANNDVPDDLLLVEQISDTFKQLAKAIPSASEDSLAKELANALTKIEELREIIEKQAAEIEALKKKGGESSAWRKGTSAFAISFGTALGAGTAAAILSGGEIMLGEYGASALNGLRNAFDGLFQAPPPTPPPSLPPSIGT